MFSIYRMLFLALKSVELVKFIPLFLTNQKKSPPTPGKCPILPPPPHWGNSLLLMIFGKSCIMILDFPFQLPCQARFLGFVLLSKILLTNQIAGFLKFHYIIKELKHKVFFMWIGIHRNSRLGLVWYSWACPK